MKSVNKKVWLLLIGFLLSATSWGQVKKISGKVTGSEDKQPLPGVTVIVKGTNKGTQANANGEFIIEAAPADILVIRFTGFLPQEVPVGNVSSFNILLQPDVAKLNEVVVVGYGQQSRSTLTSSVSRVDENVLKSVPRTNLGSALQGTAPGLRVQQNTGQPGATPTIVFRGGTNYNGSGSPLIVLDGVIVPSLFGINTEDVESIDVLKDAASAAIYGARASNGVILVTTKKGKKGRSQVTYSYRAAKNFIRRNPMELLSAEDYIIWNRRGLASRYEAAVADNLTAEQTNTKNQLTGAWGWGLNSGWAAPDGKYSTQQVNNTNRSLINDPKWNLLVDKNPFVAGQMDSILYRSISQKELEDLILQESTLQEHYVNFSGGNDQGNFALGLGGINDVGMVIGSQLSRMNLNFNGGLNVSKDFKIALNLSGYSVKTQPSYLTADNDGGITGGLIQRFGAIAPTVRLTHDITNAQLPGVDGGTLGNPKYFQDKFSNKQKEQRFSGAINLEYSLTPDLKILGTASGFIRDFLSESFNKAYINGTGGAAINTRNASFQNIKLQQYSYNGFLQYAKSFSKHDISAMAGGEFFDSRQYSYAASANNAATDYIPWLSASTAAVGIPSSGFTSWQRLASAIGRINYSYDNRYLLNVNIRYDGTSKLTDNRYGFFSGISAGWNLHNESFFQHSGISKYISTLKPRISYGSNGSIDPLGDFATVPVYGSTGIYNGNPGFATGSIFNSGLKWERANSLNFGLDVGLFNNRITLIGDYFIRNIFDKITTLNIPAWTGFTAYTTNLGQLQNKGIELEIKANVLRPQTADGLSLDIAANFFHVKNFAKKLPDNGLERNRQSTIQIWDPGSKQLIQVGGLQEGYRIGLEDEIYAPIYDGIYKTQEEINKKANLWNTFLPYTNKRIKLLGDARWRDVDGNDTLDTRDYVFVGRVKPTVQGGFSLAAAWKGFNLFAQFDYSLGFIILNQTYLRGMSQVQGSQNGPADIKSTWAPDNPNGTLPRYYWANYGRNYFMDAGGSTTAPANFWEKGNYLAVRELTLAYTLPAGMLKNATNNKIKGLKVSVTGSNLVYFTKYSGTFPEVGGNDAGRFPLPKTLTFGASVNF
ncbi:SusC/RagA family TonB-linked outer membrane protein [Chitinophaga niabensis]|uniref:TonB-linked outer membrane protein, SusC/RagA family n=1 Tax=Chitinophaga niabensis TaxID=536979 RepID=A0A1N6JZK3_9BACT|nr:SusC/RagA family TonB-linked outer membrane protein [Chitinophaga niabensis]SIO49679.1 TonB-linked outer membrane protein, SusC/RagA family [Chitinophaga niabensis]